jgi:hypothetical protein
MKTGTMGGLVVKLCLRAIVAAVVPAAVMYPAAARAQEVDDAQARALEKIKKTIAQEPGPSEVLRVAMQYFRVHPATIDALRASSHYRALLPVMSGIGTYSGTGGATAQAVSITNPQNTVGNTASEGFSGSIGVSWDLREIVFNPSELQVYALLGIQQDLIHEIARTYFMRRQLQIRLVLRPPQDMVIRVMLDLRVAEYTAILDGMTGGWFSQVIAESAAPPAAPATTTDTATQKEAPKE